MEIINVWDIYDDNEVIGYFREIKNNNKNFTRFDISMLSIVFESNRLLQFRTLCDDNGYINPDNTETLIKERVVPPTRDNIKELLKKEGLHEYDELTIFKLNLGKVNTDRIWVDFDNPLPF